MTDDVGSVTGFLHELRNGTNIDAATKAIWGRYFAQLVRLARQRLEHYRTRAVGEEDVALSTFDCLFRGLAEGRFPELSSRDGLFRLLVTITVRKAANCARNERRERRGGGRVVNEATFDAPGVLALTASAEPTPEFAAMLADEYRRLLTCLPSNEHRKIAGLKIEGLSDREIAERTGRGLRTVERKLAVIRASWARPESEW